MAKRDSNSLFHESERAKIAANAPLAVRMRPKNLDEFAGQKHFIGPGKLLRRMLDAGYITSVIFYGPPGVGKTSLARVVATLTDSKFHCISAPSASVKDIRDIIDIAISRLNSSGEKTLLFIDEIHRFNRAQQDVLLDDVENGVLTLIGATTENPYFSVNSPLISRSTLFNFENISTEDIVTLLKRAILDAERGFGKLDVDISDEALGFIAEMCDGDARRALTALEVGVLSQRSAAYSKDGKIVIDLDTAKESVQKKSIQYGDDSHYDLASALQKSMRGSDPDATVYWLARMIAGGEDLRFIARRIAICAAEDVGNADPTATLLAASALQISEFVGFPEAYLPLAQAAIYIACAPKSNACTVAISKAMADVKNGRTIQVPKHLRDAHYKGAKKLGHGDGYKYPHESDTGYVEQNYLGEAAGTVYYEPKDVGREKIVKQYLQKLKNQLH